MEATGSSKITATCRHYIEDSNHIHNGDNLKSETV
jgi:hypothetical protein